MKLLLFFIDHHMILYQLSCDKNCTFDCGPRLIGERERERWFFTHVAILILLLEEYIVSSVFFPSLVEWLAIVTSDNG
jgi:hypothetical protein